MNIHVNETHSAILVDEMNVIGQLHRIGVKGINPWNAFYEALQGYIGYPAEKHFYGANVPESTHPERHNKRAGFFRALSNKDINVHEGFTVFDTNNKFIEKGVDVMLAMDLSLFALNGTKDIIVCSGDSDLVPAIERAQSYGARIHVVVSENIPAAQIIECADVVIRLEDVLRWIPTRCIVKGHQTKQNFFKESVAI